METKIERLANDFQNEKGPFSTDLFPEARLVDELGDPFKAEYLSLFCTLDYNRSVDNLVSNILELHEQDENYFHPPTVTGMTECEMQETFTEIGFRYGNRDAAGWRENCVIITNEFGGTWNKLHAASGYHAPTLVKLMRDHDLKFIKGKKLAPFYARVVNDFVHPLDNVWQLDIPVDVHIRRLSKDLFQDDTLSDDEIRQRWKEIGQSYNISPAMVDGALWQIGYSWDDWGEDYWEDL